MLAHIARAELGAAAAFSGITFRTWPSERGRLDVEAVRSIIAPHGGPHLVSTVAVAVENTHNFGGGTVQPPDQLAAVVELARANDLALHLDGARLWNAHVATGSSMAELAQPFDTVSVCLSKGLGAPVGSVLVASADRIAEARVWRKRYGAGMRQVGILAAAGRYALAHNVERLADDHARAARLAEALTVPAAGAGSDPGPTTNIVVLHVGRRRDRGGEGSRGGRSRVSSRAAVPAAGHPPRLDDDDIERAIAVLAPLVGTA